MIVSRNRVFGRLASIAVWTTAITSPASDPIIVKPRMRSPFAATSTLMKPRVSDNVRDRNTTAIGSFAKRTAMPWHWASLFANADTSERWVGEDAVGNQPVARRCAIAARQIVPDHAEIVE